MPELEVPPVGNPNTARPARLIDGFKDASSNKTTLVATTSKTLAELLTTALPYSTIGVTLVTDGSVQYNPAGEADANSGFIPSVYTIHGGKDFLDTIELYAAAQTTVSIIAFEAFNA